MRPGYFSKKKNKDNEKAKPKENAEKSSEKEKKSEKDLTELRDRCRVSQMALYEEPLCKAPVRFYESLKHNCCKKDDIAFKN